MKSKFNYKKFSNKLKKYYIFLDPIIIYRPEIPITLKCKKCGKIKTKRFKSWRNNYKCTHNTKYKYNTKYRVNKGKVPLYKPIDLTNADWKDSKLIHGSHGEGWIRYLLDSNNIKYQSPKSLSYHRLRYDFFIVGTNILIEYDGSQHHHSVKLFGGSKQLEKQQLHDKLKTEYANRHGYQLYRIKTRSPRVLQRELIKIFFNHKAIY